MPKTPITHPHDFLVKATFGRKEVVQNFLESWLSQETRQRIAMDSLKLTNKSFTPWKGKNKHSDLIYAATMGWTSRLLTPLSRVPIQGRKVHALKAIGVQRSLDASTSR